MRERKRGRWRWRWSELKVWKEIESRRKLGSSKLKKMSEKEVFKANEFKC